MKKDLTVIGAGPKSLAIAAKVKVLKDLGFSVPSLRIVEKSGVGAYWKTGTGFTNGRLELGTPPEKDIGYPYSSWCWGDAANHEVNQGMMAFSWQSFLIKNQTYSDWIDRGKPAPSHHQWREYLLWIFEKVSPVVNYIEADFNKLALSESGRWQVAAKNRAQGDVAFDTDGVVLTGPGEIKTTENIKNDPRIMDVNSIWSRLGEIKNVTQRTSIALIGNGETAASAAVELGKLDAPLKIEIITPVATNYSRGESFSENHMYTDPFQGNWHDFTVEDRKNFIERTDRGVFSLAAKKKLDHMDNVSVIAGWFRKIAITAANQLVVEMDYAGKPELRSYDYVVLTTGFDPLKFLSLRTSEQTKKQIMKKAGLSNWASEDFQGNIIEDLSLSGIGLHLPMLAALAQGPGFPNLSCLGRLSDQILLSYVSLDRV